MIEDFRSTTCPGAFDADLCIIGAGPAGITIAREFAGTPWNVCLLESGGLRSERDSQALSAGVSVGPCALDPAGSRLRAFGGAARLWGGGVIPLSSLDMSARDWVPDSGWPIGWDELAPYYLRATEACRVDPGELEDGGYLPPRRAGRRAAPSVNVDGRTNRISPLDYGRAHLDLMRSASNLRLLLHANLLRLEAVDGASAVRSALIGSLDGRRGRINARVFVLAAGGIENARLLLLSDDVARNGLGNDRDLVGRYFMEHPRCAIGTFRSRGVSRLADWHSRPLDRAAAPAYQQLSLSVHAQHAHRLLNARAWPFPIERPVPPGLQSLRALRASLRRVDAADESGQVEQELLDALSQDLPVRPPAPVANAKRVRLALRTVLHGGDVVRAACRKLVRRSPVEIDRVEMVGYFEQAPNRDSRVSLSQQRDALGSRMAQVDWRMSAIDEDSFRTSAGLIGRDVAAHFQCEFEPARWLRDAGAKPRLHGTAHHLGTTRMSESPASGVVDARCRVHGVDNLYVAGSSVFPTGGWAFPTLTIVALALRITDDLRARLGEWSMLGML